jgi:RecA-family ATPase
MGAPEIAARDALVERWFDATPASPPPPPPPPPTPAEITWIDPAAWTGQNPPPREWEVEGWIPRHEVTLLYGDGGIGKTLLIHQYATAAAAGRPWLGQKTRQARVMCFFCEDSSEELHRRQVDINASFQIGHKDLGGLRLASRKHEDNLLAAWDRSGSAMKLTPAWHRLKRDAIAFGADVLVIDTIADVYGGSEIDRVQVNAFVKGCLGSLAKAIGGSVIALGHPSLSGKSTGSGTSGSTAWSNAARSRIYLRYPEKTDSGNIRELEGMKLNYGPKGSLLKLRWERGAFAVIAGRMSAAEAATAFPASLIPRLDDAAEDATVRALNECANVQMSTAPNSPHFAPKVLKRRLPEILQAFSADEVWAAIGRLERTNVIRYETIGRNMSRHPVYGFVVVPDNMSSAEPTEQTVFS